MHSSETKQIGIIGGGGAIGRVVTTYFQQLGYTTLISDPGVPDALSLNDLLDRCKQLYITVFPLEIVVDILNKIAQRPDAADFIILENSSIKSFLDTPFAQLDQLGASVCATHPLCKADQPWKNQNVLLIPYGRHAHQAEALARDLYTQAEMNIKEVSTIAEHDELMAILQLVPHLVLRMVSAVFTELGVDLDLLTSVATANFKLFYLSFWRVMVQNPNLSAAIIAQLLKQDKGREIYQRLMIALQHAPLQDLSDMSAKFESFYDHDQLTTAYMSHMNRQGIVALERLANLARRSITITSTQNHPGLLREILEPFDNHHININAIDSHFEGDAVYFEIGYDGGVTAETLTQLRHRIETMGHTITIEDHT